MNYFICPVDFGAESPSREVCKTSIMVTGISRRKERLFSRSKDFPVRSPVCPKCSVRIHPIFLSTPKGSPYSSLVSYFPSSGCLRAKFLVERF